MGNKINLNELESALKDLTASKNQLDNFDIKNMSSYSMLKVDDQVRIAIIDLRAAVKECCDIFADVTSDLGTLVKKIKNADNSRNLDTKSTYYQPYDYSKLLKKDKKNSSSESDDSDSGQSKTSTSSRTSSGKSGTDKTDKKTKKKKKKKKTASKKGKAKSKLVGAVKATTESTGTVVSSTLPSLIENKTILKDPTPNNQNIADVIKNNDDTVISAQPINSVDQNIDNNVSISDNNVDISSNNGTAVTATEIKNENPEVKPQVYEGEIKVVGNNNDTNTNTNVVSSNTSQQRNYTNNSSNISNNTSTSVGTTPSVQEQQAPVESTPKVNISDNDKVSSTPKLITIDDNSNMEVKKSNKLGTAIPIGLGSAALGTVAVVGARYMKNKHNEDNDEDSNSDDNLEYSDSANYDDYSDNIDLEPEGSTYEDVEIEDTYVDPEDLGEDYENYDEDSVLDDLNSNY